MARWEERQLHTITHTHVCTHNHTLHTLRYSHITTYTHSCTTHTHYHALTHCTHAQTHTGTQYKHTQCTPRTHLCVCGRTGVFSWEAPLSLLEGTNAFTELSSECQAL